MPTVREATVCLLRELGMTTIFGNPGSTELPLFRDFPDEFRYVLGLQESVVVGMADGYAQATGNAALVNLHSAAPRRGGDPGALDAAGAPVAARTQRTAARERGDRFPDRGKYSGRRLEWGDDAPM
jgi:thiamine pyrophosphate-dependent acetolactate synthase large subunit-like protein